MSNKLTFLTPFLVTVCYSAVTWFLFSGNAGHLANCTPLKLPKFSSSESYQESVVSKEISIKNVSSSSSTIREEGGSPLSGQADVWAFKFARSESDTTYYNKSTSLTLDNYKYSNITTLYEQNSTQTSSTNGTDVRVHTPEAELSSTRETHKALNDGCKVNHKLANVHAIRVQDVRNGVTYDDSGVSLFLENESATIMLLGHHFTNRTHIRFVTEARGKGCRCSLTSESKVPPKSLSNISPDGSSAIVVVSFPSDVQEKLFFICIRESDSESSYWIHQGNDPWTTIKTTKRLLPFWLQVLLIIVLLFISGLFAGLTLGLLALDRTDLKILMSTGSESERRYAGLILPLREKGNYLLCSLVLGNVLVNSTLTILLDDLTTGLFAVILSTVGIVIIGEILPQAVCSRYGLEIGAKTIWITKCVMLLTFPVSYIISKILDKLLGEEIGFVYNRENLKELITVTSDHNNLEADEVNIISGALTMRKKTVEDIMIPLEKVYMLPLESVLDYSTLREIRTEGYSRIPIYEHSRTNIVSVLYTKDLIFVDPDDGTPLQSLAAGHANECFFVLGDTTLDVVFKEFNETKRGHMAFVQKIDSDDEDKDPVFVTIGLITLEDVIEELIQYNRQVTT